MRRQDRKLILHIGRHKSGTTAIQRFLHYNQTELLNQGYLYPSFGREPNAIAHHLICYPMRKKDLRINPQKIEDLDDLRILKEEINNSHADNIVISSEVFQNCEPSFVKKAFQEYETKVVVYLREPLDYLASAYCQRVHATQYPESIENFYRDSFKLNYFRFLKSWSKPFNDNIIVNKYSKEFFYENDLIKDFLKKGMQVESFDNFNFDLSQNANQSLNSKILQFKLHLNRSEDVTKTNRPGHYQGLVKLNSYFPSGKYRLSNQKLVDEVIKDTKKSNAKVAKCYFDEPELFDNSTYSIQPSEELTDSEISAMTQKLDELSNQ